MAARPRAEALPPPELGGHDEELVRFAAAAWPLRAAEELRLAMIFRAILRAARRHDETWLRVWDRTLALLVGDELRHARLCADVGARLGAGAPRYDLAPVRKRLDGLPSARGRLGALVLVEAAIGESVSTALFFAGRAGSTEPLTRAALSLIVRDEVRHAGTGWRVLEQLWRSADGSARAALQAEATRGLASIEQDTAIPALRRLEAGEVFDPRLTALGVLDPALRVERFYDTIERVVLPRLSRIGLDGASAWQERHRPTRAVW